MRWWICSIRIRSRVSRMTLPVRTAIHIAIIRLQNILVRQGMVYRITSDDWGRYNHRQFLFLFCSRTGFRDCASISYVMEAMFLDNRRGGTHWKTQALFVRIYRLVDRLNYEIPSAQNDRRFSGQSVIPLWSWMMYCIYRNWGLSRSRCQKRWSNNSESLRSDGRMISHTQYVSHLIDNLRNKFPPPSEISISL